MIILKKDSINGVRSDGSMYGYVWQVGNEVPTFGEHWVYNGVDPIKSVWGRVKSGVGKRFQKHKQEFPIDTDYQKGSVKLHWLKDLSEYAQTNCPERLKPHGKIDDHLYLTAGLYNKQGELYDMPVDEIKRRLDSQLTRKASSKVQIYNLVVWETIKKCVYYLAQGHKRIACDLTARFGKTIWTILVALTSEVEDLIVASYTHTVFGSFKSDATTKDFGVDIAIIDMRKKSWRHDYQLAVLENKFRIIFMPLTKNDEMQERYKFIENLKTKKLWDIEEADLGTSTKKVNPALQKAVGNDSVLIESGTLDDRTIKLWNVSKVLSVTYMELLVQQRKQLQDKLDKGENIDA